MGNTISELSELFPGTPPFTEKDLPDQAGKVFIVTGASSGIGLELAYILYLRNAKIYMAARSEEKVSKAMSMIKSRVPNSKGSLIYLHLDLGDLTTIKSSAETFLRDNNRLDVLWNNAGVMVPPQGSKTTQGYELQLSTNNVAPFLFTKLLHPVLTETAKTAPTDSVRVLWVSSSGADHFSPKGGIDMNNLDYKNDKTGWRKYGISKVGNIFHGSEFARRARGEGIVSVSLHPGALKTELTRNTPAWQYFLIKFILYDPIFGAYTELFAGLSPEVTMSKTGAYIAPWGHFKTVRKDKKLGMKSEKEKGTGTAEKFWEWSEDQVKAYV